MLGYAGWYGRDIYREILFYLPLQQVLLMPPVLYFYFRSLLDQTFQFQKKDWLHFVPAFAYLIYSLLVFMVDHFFSGFYYFYENQRDKDFEDWYNGLGVASMLFYLLVSLKQYECYRRISVEELSFADAVSFSWARKILWSFIILLILRILFFVLHPEWGSFGQKFWYYIAFSLLLYYISIRGYFNTVSSKVSFQNVSQAEGLPNLIELNLKPIILEDKEKESDLEEELALTHWAEQLEELMKREKLYEQPELVISDLAKRMGLPSKKISQIINQRMGVNFNDYVNRHRTWAVLKKLENGMHHRQTLLSIAFECGFNSKTTFNRAFKKITSKNPKDFIDKLGKI